MKVVENKVAAIVAYVPSEVEFPHTSYEAVLDFARYGVLRVLDLKECDDHQLSYNHIWAICDQALMKYQSINPAGITCITRRIGNLGQLETLDLSGRHTVTVYKEVLLLPKLNQQQ